MYDLAEAFVGAITTAYNEFEDFPTYNYIEPSSTDRVIGELNTERVNKLLSKFGAKI